jgi:uncharacterized protein (DUF2236 family)
MRAVARITVWGMPTSLTAISSRLRSTPPNAEAGGAPLGPGSLTWKHLGDARGALVAQRAGVLQVMHPAIAAALIDHSDFFENPLARLIRSAGPILGVIYDEDAEATARWVRERHPQIRGRDNRGKRYHALDPDTYYWAHATFFEAQIATQELFGTPLSDAEKEQLYAESITWYARYGLTMRPVPRDYAAFERYWQSMFEDVLRATPIALAAVRRTRGLPAPYPAIDGLAWAAMGPLIGFGAPWLTRGTLPPRAREILKVTWSRNDELALNGLRSFVRTAWPIVPPRLSRLPRAA